ncbi:hypothetical protein ILYODFUR_017132 [Ilyodon furcidens]|uniref:Uncharacterized protein n=1 Tax=Ilyodon furcidens TaxID=33524 RepID=A0ABV0USN9_9TELE
MSRSTEITTTIGAPTSSYIQKPACQYGSHSYLSDSHAHLDTPTTQVSKPCLVKGLSLRMILNFSRSDCTHHCTPNTRFTGRSSLSISRFFTSMDLSCCGIAVRTLRRLLIHLRS